MNNILEELKKQKPFKWLENDKSVTKLYNWNGYSLLDLKGEERLYQIVKEENRYRLNELKLTE